MKSVAILGAGRLGTSLAYALSQRGFCIEALSSRSQSSAEESRQRIGQGIPTTDNVFAASKGEVIFLTVPDDRIADIVKELADSPLSWEDKVVFHCSGLLTSAILNPLRSKGAHTGSAHPCNSFPIKQSEPSLFEGIFFAIEGDSLAESAAISLVKKIGSFYFKIRPKNKARYHIACSMASNMSVVLFYTAQSLLGQCGIAEEEAKKILWPLLEGTLHNVNKIDIFDALTGPISRGDVTTIQKHLAELKKFPKARQIYIELAKQALEMAKQGDKIPDETVSAVEALLEHE
jgi:predicted short-subunit dehydrogenase-like oxidoreductase (DUF2520 family)